MMVWYFICILVFLYVFSKLTCGRCKSKSCLVGKTAIITGGNSGIGFQVALGLASRGCKVIVADKVISDESRSQIIEETGNRNVVFKHLDLGSFQSVRKFAKEITSSEDKLHILINNAGIGDHRSAYTDDGLHNTLQVNYFGHFLLTHLLIDLLKKSAPSRIIFTSSIGAFMTWMKVGDLNPPKTSGALPSSYCNSKLCQTIAANGFAERLKTFDITSNSCHPGGVKSDIYLSALRQQFSLSTIGLWMLTMLFGKNTEEGAQTILHLACERRLNNVTGQFFLDCIQSIQPFQAYNKKLCNKVWEKSVEYVKLRPEEMIS